MPVTIVFGYVFSVLLGLYGFVCINEAKRTKRQYESTKGKVLVGVMVPGCEIWELRFTGIASILLAVGLFLFTTGVWIILSSFPGV